MKDIQLYCLLLKIIEILGGLLPKMVETNLVSTGAKKKFES